jgi:heme a synthase
MKSNEPNSPRWLHALAVLTVLAALPLLLLGAEVTSRDVGMADQAPLRTPWHLLTIDWSEYGLGFLIEHLHRTAGWLVGLFAIASTAALWWREPRRWVCWVGTAALVTVIVQGLLGIFRVQLNAIAGRNLSLIHGCFAQLVFALLVSVALFTSRMWTSSQANENAGIVTRPLRVGSIIVAALVYLQIVLGAVVRHTSSPAGPRLHLLAAFVVVAAVAWLCKIAVEQPVRDATLQVFVWVLPLLLALQIVLGIEAWLGKFNEPRTSLWSQLRPLLSDPTVFRSLHYVFGSCLFSCAVLVCLWAHRRPLEVGETSVTAVKHLEGVL